MPFKLVANAHFMWAFCVCDEVCVVTNLVPFLVDHWACDGFRQRKFMPLLSISAQDWLLPVARGVV